MDFTFSADQDALRDAVRAFLADHAAMDHTRAMAEDSAGVRAEVWARIAELGWTGVLVPTEHGGLGLGLVDMVVVMEELGRVCFPGPFMSSAGVATLAARALDDADLLRRLATGVERGTVALEEAGHGSPVDRVSTRVRRKGADWVATGTKSMVLDGHTADFAIVVARTEAGLGSFLLEAPAATETPIIDPTRKVARLELDETPVIPLGADRDHTDLWRRVCDDTGVLLAAELVGSGEEANRLAVAYAQARVQFGRPLAKFQVLRHKMVDMLHRLELARVGTHYAAWTSDVDDPMREQAAAMCIAEAAEAAVAISGDCIQIHGGVGFTWDCDAHFHYKRAKANDLLFGQQGYHRGRVADLVLDG